MNKKSIIFIALAIVLAIVGFFSTNTSKETEVISKAEYVSDGKLLSENEGKIVIVAGKAEATEPFIDTLTKAEIPHIRAIRNVEIYESVPEVDENGKTQYVMQWKPTLQEGVNKFDANHSTQLVAKCKVGEIEIDENILKNISASKKLHDIDRKGPASLGYNVQIFKNVTYVSKVDHMPAGGEKKTYGIGKQNVYMDYEGYIRVSYTVPYEDVPEYTFIGKQQGGKLVYDKDLGMQTVFAGIHTPAELKETVESGGMVGAIVAWVLAAFLLFLGIYTMKNKYVPTDEEMKE